jgi:hypothetical protein
MGGRGFPSALIPASGSRPSKALLLFLFLFRNFPVPFFQAV